MHGMLCILTPKKKKKWAWNGTIRPTEWVLPNS